MVLKRTLNHNYAWLILLSFVLSANYSLYHTPIGIKILPKQPNLIVAASMIDLALIAPILFLAWKRKINAKNLIFGVAGCLILVRFLIPMEYLAPFEAVTWVGFAIEGGGLLFEILILVSLISYMPNIVRTVKDSPLPVLFSFSKAVEKQVKSYPIIQMICSEMLMFYYALISWKKKPQIGTNAFTLHKNSSYIAIQVMLIHAVIFETAGLHWWLHEKSSILSIILVVINLYTVLFFIADIQVVRHNPLLVTEDKMYLSLGLMKRRELNWLDIEEIIVEPHYLKQKILKDTLDFMARDFEEVHPDFILKLKRPVKVTLIMGIKKEYSQVAIRVDEPSSFKIIVKEKVEHASTAR